MLILPGTLKSRITGAKVLRYATCWRVVRTDGIGIRVTDHNARLNVLDEDPVSHFYTPVTAFTTTAAQKEAGLRERNADLMGAISTDLITHDDLRAGLYRDAIVTEMLVDWSAPWAGPFYFNKYILISTKYNGEYWEGTIAGNSIRLRKPTGLVYNRTCQHDVFDEGCKLNPADFVQSGQITGGILDPRLKFNINVSQPNGYFSRGEMTFTGGANDGLTFEIADYNGVTIVLYERTPYDVAVSDPFDILPGCDQLFTTCQVKFNNVVNFFGFPYLPGNDRLIRTPDAR